MLLTTYDFIIVGGGTAGLVLASRLSEDPTQRILVLEAGTDLSEDISIKTPGLYHSLKNTEADWGFRSQPQRHLNGRTLDLNQGKGLGGSSSINAQVFAPPTWTSLDTWDSVLGNSGWNRNSLKEYYARASTFPSVNQALETVLGVDGWTKSTQRGNGPIQLSLAGDAKHPIRKAWADTFRAKGMYMGGNPLCDMSDDSAMVGSFSCLSSTDPVSKTRSYATSAYLKTDALLHPVKDRPNLLILTGASVEKILFGGVDAKRATAVQYKHNGKTLTASPAKEVILAAGALQSPKILELSGIGIREILEKHGIELVKDLPVGENLQDHLVCGVSFEAVDHLETLDDIVRQEPLAVSKAMEEYNSNKTRTGPLTHIGMHTYAFLPIMTEPGRRAIEKAFLDNAPPAGDRRDEIRARAYYEIVKRSALNPKEPSAAYLSGTGQVLHPVDPDSDSPVGPVPGKFITLGILPSQPLSRGSVHIGSSDPSAAPIIDPNYLSNPIDAEIMAQQMLYLEEIANSPPLSNLLKHPLRRRDPASHITNVTEAKRFAETTSVSMWHYTGTCAMLPEEAGGVVSPELKVYGVEGLRVVDSSAVPLISTANIQSTIYAFAEKAADLIKQEYGLK